jgi:hypothetical protein
VVLGIVASDAFQEQSAAGRDTLAATGTIDVAAAE